MPIGGVASERANSFHPIKSYFGCIFFLLFSGFIAYFDSVMPVLTILAVRDLTAELAVLVILSVMDQ